MQSGKDRLKVIKEVVKNNHVFIRPVDYLWKNEKYFDVEVDWFIEQAEKVEQLQQEIMRLSHENIGLQRHISRQETDMWNLEMENGRLKKLANLIIEESRWGNIETALETVVSITKRMVEGEG